MLMAWIESHQELARHPKTKKFARLLGVSIPAAVGHLHFLWWWAMDYADDGDLSRFDAHDIADACGWDGDSKLIEDSLREAGFIDINDNGTRIHDWNRGRWSRKQKSEIRRQWESMARYVRPYILERDEYTCQECGTTDGPQEIDHIIPIAADGTNELDNLQVLCLPCNRRKGAN